MTILPLKYVLQLQYHITIWLKFALAIAILIIRGICLQVRICFLKHSPQERGMKLGSVIIYNSVNTEFYKFSYFLACFDAQIRNERWVEQQQQNIPTN